MENRSADKGRRLSAVKDTPAINRSTSAIVAVFQTLSSNVFILLLTIVTGILTARFLGPQGRGEQAAMGVWPQLFAFCFTLGIPETIIYKAKSDPSRAPQLIYAALLLATAAGTLAGLVGAAVLPFWLTKYSTETIRYAQWAMLSTPVCSAYFTASACLQSAGRFRLYNALQVSMPILTVLFLFGLLFVDRFTPVNTMAAYIFPVLPSCLVSLVLVRRVYGPVRKITLGLFGEIILYGLRVWGVDLLKTLSRQSDRAVLLRLLSPADLGIYVVAQSVVSVLSVLHNSVFVVLYPTAAGRSTAEIMGLSGLAIRACAVVVGISAVVLCMVAGPLLEIVYGPGFGDAIVPIRILAVEAVLAGVNILSLQVFMAAGRPAVAAALQVVGLVSFIPIAFLLVPGYGLPGAALAWLISSGLRLIAAFCCFPLVLLITPPWPFITLADIKEIKTKVFTGVLRK